MTTTRTIVLALAAGAVCTTTAAAQQVTLTSSASSAGLIANYSPNAAGYPGDQEVHTGGAAVGDFNNDGCMDIFWVGGGNVIDRLWINDCDGTGHFHNQTAAWNLADYHCGNGVAVGDYDNDGRMDIFVTSFGLPEEPAAGSHRLLHNDGGSFTDVAAQAGVSQSCTLPPPPNTNPAGYGAAFGDYDLDGDLDLAVTSWWGNDGGNRLCRNNGDGTFTDVTAAALGSAVNGVWGFQPAFVDMDGDRYPELLISADFHTSRYFINNRDGTFTDATAASGTGLDDNGMGQTVADFDNDGILDWYVTSIHKDNPLPGNNPGNMLYMGLGDHLYAERSVAAGVNDGGWGWGTVAVDLDQDTWTDIVEVNGRPGGGEWEGEPGYVYHNDGNASFTEIGASAGFGAAGEGRGLALLDADQDGDLDIIVCNYGSPLGYYRNDTAGGNALRIFLDTSTNPLLAPNGFGTRVIATIGDVQIVRYMSSSPSYLATSEPALHLGLGAADRVDELRLEWSRGYVTVMQDVPAAAGLTITAPGLGDLNADGVVGTADFLAVLTAWGPCPAAPAPCLADLNGDGQVSVADFLLVLSNWG